MTTKNKIIVIITCVILEASLLAGSYSIGRFMRYKGTTKVGEDAEQNVKELSVDIGTVTDNVTESIGLLSSSQSSVDTLSKTVESLNKSKDAVMECLDNFVIMIDNSQKNIDNFKKSYEGIKQSDEYTWDLMIKEAQELEDIQSKYQTLLEDYNALKEGK